MSGIYIARERNADTEEERQRWLAADLALQQERAALDPDDEQGLIAARARWAQQIHDLKAGARLGA